MQIADGFYCGERKAYDRRALGRRRDENEAFYDETILRDPEFRGTMGNWGRRSKSRR